MRIIYEVEVSSIVAPGEIGYLGIMSNHAPIITSLKPGKLKITDNKGSVITLALSGGFLENSNNICSILADSAEYANDIDIERAKESMVRAKQRLRDAAGNIDMLRAQTALEKAKNRVTIASDK